LAAFNNFNSSFYETRRSRVGIEAPVASLTGSTADAADDTVAGTALSGLAHVMLPVKDAYIVYEMSSKTR